MSQPIIPILLYHSVAERVSEKFSPWAVNPDLFAAHMGFLRDHCYTPLTVSQFVAKMIAQDTHLPERPVVITFDDGLNDFYTDAFPILAKHGFSATLYITTGYVGGRSRWLVSQGEGERPMLSWEKIRELDVYGIECGAHSQTHPELDTLPLDAAREEITLSKRTLEAHLGKRVDTFAYPHGYHNLEVQHLIVQAGYSSACAVKHAMSSIADDRFGLARIIIKSDTHVNAFKGLLSGEGLRVAPFQERASTKVWRYVRRSSATVRGYAAQ